MRCKKWHGVWKLQKKSHSTLRAKRANFTFWVAKNWLKITKNGRFWRVLEKLNFAIKQCCQTYRSTLIGHKSGGKRQNWKTQVRHFQWFSNTVNWSILEEKYIFWQICIFFLNLHACEYATIKCYLWTRKKKVLQTLYKTVLSRKV